MWSSRHSSDAQRQGKASETSNFAQTCNLLSRYMKEKGSLRDLNLEIGGKVESLEALVKPGSSLAASLSASMNFRNNSGKSAQPSSEEHSSIITVDDAPTKASTSKEGSKRDTKSSQLTIFYCGRVLVFEDYPVDKVKELVSVAKRSSSKMSYGITSNTLQEKAAPSTSVAREGLPPRPHSSVGKHTVVGISSNTCKAKMHDNNGGRRASSSKANEHPSPETEANGSDLPIARRSSLHRFLEKKKDRAAVRGPYHNQEHPARATKCHEQLDLNTIP